QLEPVTVEAAEQAAITWARASGMSLADRLCLAVGHHFDAIVWTADNSWGYESIIGRTLTAANKNRILRRKSSEWTTGFEPGDPHLGTDKAPPIAFSLARGSLGGGKPTLFGNI